MNRIVAFSILFSITIGFLGICPAEGGPIQQGLVTFSNNQGLQTCRFLVEIQLTPEEISRGLMYRKSLPRDRGMLFVFPEEMKVAFWMKNTLIPLDMIFINSSLKVVHIHFNAIPLDETLISSLYPVRYVLEIVAGSARQCGIVPGNVVTVEPVK